MSKPSKSTKAKADAAQVSLADLMTRLSEIVAWFSGENVDLEQATVKYGEGMALAEQIRQRLAQTENQINQIMLQYDKSEK